jgi:hypothetical protein
MQIEQLQNIINSKTEAAIDEWTITVEQAEMLFAAYHGLSKPENRELFLKQSPFTLLSFLGKIGFTVVKPEAPKTT